MRKILAIAASALLLAGCGTSIQFTNFGTPDKSVVGTWSLTEKTSENGGEGVSFDSYTFNADGTFTETGYIKMEMRDTSSVTYFDISFQGGGKYGVADGCINFDFAPGQAKATLDRFDMDMGSKYSEKDNSLASSLLKMILVNPMLKAMKKTMKSDQIYRIDSVTSKALTITNAGATDASPNTNTKEK